MKVRIGKTAYDIRRIDRFQNPLVRGSVNYQEKLIQIANRSGTPLRKRSERGLTHTLWHELIHAILNDMNSAKERDEVFVDELATRIQQVLNQRKVFGHA